MSAEYFLISAAWFAWHLHGWLSSFSVSAAWLPCAVQVKDCAPVIARTKERLDNEPVNGELQLKEPQWPCMLGIGPDDIKEWNRHWGHGGHAFRKEVLFALYQSDVSHEEKTIQTDLKKRILPYAPTPYVTLIEGLIRPLLIDADAITHSWQYANSIKTGHKTQRWTVKFIIAPRRAVLRSTFFLRICCWTDRIFVLSLSDVFCTQKKKKKSGCNSREVCTWVG